MQATETRLAYYGAGVRRTRFDAARARRSRIPCWRGRSIMIIAGMKKGRSHRSRMGHRAAVDIFVQYKGIEHQVRLFAERSWPGVDLRLHNCPNFCALPGAVC